MNEMFEELVDTLDRDFPKGVRDRGKALVLFAEAIIYAHQWAKREHERGVKEGMEKVYTKQVQHAQGGKVA